MGSRRSVATVDVLIPTLNRPAALAVTLVGLIGQTWRDFTVVISDQTDGDDVLGRGEVTAVLRVLEHRGHEVRAHHHVPRCGVAENREFLLDQSRASYALCLDDDVLLEPDALERLVRHLREQRCGFVGMAVTGLSHLDDVRPDEQAIEPWAGRVAPELVTPGSPAWQRHRLHNAANMVHVAAGLPGDLLYKVAWIGGCVLYDVAKLRAVGGYGFWRQLPRHSVGEDVLAQLRVMATYGGAGLLPSGAHHLQLPTTLPRRDADAPRLLPVARR